MVIFKAPVVCDIIVLKSIFFQKSVEEILLAKLFSFSNGKNYRQETG